MTYPSYGGQQNPYPSYQQVAPQPSGYPGTYLPQPRRRRNTAALLLSIALVATLALAATFTALYFVESGEHNATAATLQTRDGELADANSTVKDTQAKLSDAEKGRDQAQGEVTELTKCRDATRAYMKAVVDGKQDIKKEIDEMVQRCA